MDPYIGEVRIFAGTYAPEGWLFCQGQMLSVAQYQALFAVIGDTYGGDGKKTFSLPDLRGRVPIAHGQGKDLSLYGLGKAGGESKVALSVSQIPEHVHQPKCTTAKATSSSPDNAIWAKGNTATDLFYTGNDANTPMYINAFQVTGGNQLHNNLQPYLGINFIIAIEGEFPTKS